MKKIFSLFITVLLAGVMSAQENLYLIGDACSAGWEAGNALAMTKNGDTFTWTGQLNPGELKFLTTQGSWDNCYGSDEYNKDVWAGGDYTFAALTDGDRKFKIMVHGEYTITISGSTINFAWTTSVYPIGSGTSAGWEISQSLPLTATNSCTLEGVVSLNGSGELKFLCQQNWGKHYGPAEGGTALDATGEHDITLITNSEDHKYAVGLTGDYNIRLDAALGKMYVTPVRSKVDLKGLGDWNGWQMIESADHMSCSYTIGLMHGQHEFKIYSHEGEGQWFGADYEMKREYCTDVQTYSTGLEPNIKLHVDISGNYTFTYYYDTRKVSVTYPEIPTIDIKGIGGDWTGVRMTDASDHLTATYTYTLTAGNYEFCLYKSDWAKFAEGTTFVRGGEAVLVGGSENATFTADIDGDYTFVYDYNAGTLQIIYPDLPVPEEYLKGLNSDGFASIYMPYNFTLPAGVEAYKGAMDGDAIELTKVTQDVLPKETGLILYSASRKSQSITLTESFEEATAVTDNAFTGTLTDTDKSNVYVLAHTTEPNSTGFYYISETIEIPANRAYLPGTVGSGAPLRIRFASNVTTDVEQLEAQTASKLIRNGRVRIIRDGKVYTILGQIEK